MQNIGLSGKEGGKGVDEAVAAAGEVIVWKFQSPLPGKCCFFCKLLRVETLHPHRERGGERVQRHFPPLPTPTSKRLTRNVHNEGGAFRSYRRRN